MPLASCRIEGNWAVGKGGATERRKHMATMGEKINERFSHQIFVRRSE